MNIVLTKVSRTIAVSAPRGRFNIDMLSYQYRDSHHKDKTASRPSYLYDRSTYTYKDSLYLETGPRKIKITIIIIGSAVDMYEKLSAAV